MSKDTMAGPYATPNGSLDGTVKPAKAPRRILSADPELQAMADCWKILEGLPQEQRVNVMEYLHRKAVAFAHPKPTVDALIGREAA